MNLYYIAAAAIYLLVTACTSWKINQSVILAKQQKMLNIVLNVLIPVLWFYLVFPVLFPKDKVMTKDERDQLLKKERGTRLDSSATASSTNI